ncbi:helix-hairpin-helix domain-containing protein [Geodermatophilus sp. CPCC 206100]|uniref:helix-hairpin-helix domain-containing protein n=1 Tax=Geodermatophilus sp. CPCC 206100 TaxID=3020054 RepID=UPI003AFFC2E5
MRLSSRRSDDADLIRARLRALLDEGGRTPGWVPDDAPVDPGGPPVGGSTRADEEDEDGAGLPDGIGRHRTPGSAVRLDPGRRGAWSLWVVGGIAALLVAIVTWASRPQVELAPPLPPETTTAAVPSESPPAAASVAADASATVVVSVVGLVARPGLVTLPEGARVADAVAASGGLLPEADPATVNLAAVVADGQQIAVGVPGAPAATGAAAGPGGGPGPVDLNAATAADLDALPGIGPVLAQRIVDHREQQGPFRSVEQLDDVPGIGPATFAELAELVRV